MSGKALNKQEMDSIDLAKFVFAFAVIHIHAGGGTVVNPILASIVNSFDSLAVPFFFIVAGYFFFNRIEKLENEAQKKEYAISYLLKTLKIYFVWSVVLLPSRLILSKSSMLGVLLKWFRTVFFIGDAQLWYLNALLIGLILILILKKSKINDTWIMLIGVVFFIAGIFVQKQLDVASVNGYAGFWKLYYMIWGKTIKNGVFMGMFYCMLGTLIQKIPQTKTVFICTISAFTLYVVGVYFQYEWRKLLLPVVSVLVVESVIMLPLHIGSLGKWLRSMSTLLFLCHYIFVRAFECFPTLAVCFPEGIHKFMFVGVSAFLLSALLVWAGNKNKRIRWLWQ